MEFFADQAQTDDIFRGSNVPLQTCSNAKCWSGCGTADKPEITNKLK